MNWRHILLSSVVGCLLFFAVLPRSIRAADVLGVHILNTGELNDATALLKTDQTKDHWDYVTIPFTLDDVGKTIDWQRFFYQARELKFQPIIRLTTRFDPGKSAWSIPTRKDIVELSSALSALDCQFRMNVLWWCSTSRTMRMNGETNWIRKDMQMCWSLPHSGSIQKI
jgi:hypothetical protein